MTSSSIQPNLIKYEEYLSQFVLVILCIMIILNVLHNTSLSFITVVTYWILNLPWKAFLATFGIPFLYFLMLAHMHDLASIQICLPEFVASFNIFERKNTNTLKSSKWGLECVAMGTKFFIVVGTFSVELLAYQGSMVCAANWSRCLYEIHFEITGYPCYVIDSQQGEFTNGTIFCSKSHLFLSANENGTVKQRKQSDFVF